MTRAREAIARCLEVQADAAEPLDFIGVQKITVARLTSRRSPAGRSSPPQGRRASRSQGSRAATTSCAMRTVAQGSYPSLPERPSVLASWQQSSAIAKSTGMTSPPCCSGRYSRASNCRVQPTAARLALRGGGTVRSPRITTDGVPSPSRVFRALYGKPAWHVHRSWGPFLTFEFGEPHRHIREPHRPKRKMPPKVGRLPGRRGVTVEGEGHPRANPLS